MGIYNDIAMLLQTLLCRDFVKARNGVLYCRYYLNGVFVWVSPCENDDRVVLVYIVRLYMCEYKYICMYASNQLTIIGKY